MHRNWNIKLQRRPVAIREKQNQRQQAQQENSLFRNLPSSEVLAATERYGACESLEPTNKWLLTRFLQQKKRRHDSWCNNALHTRSLGVYVFLLKLTGCLYGRRSRAGALMS